uniref:Uncharacterized protein n=1 Tax=Acrobeloides nanus TaxID=290746 RepID=A0A914C2Q9_9BILA
MDLLKRVVFLIVGIIDFQFLNRSGFFIIYKTKSAMLYSKLATITMVDLIQIILILKDFVSVVMYILYQEYWRS